MKKITTAAFILLSAVTTGHAQLPDGAATELSIPLSTPLSTAVTAHPYAIHIKAVRNLYERYGDGNNETWYATGYGFRAKFSQNGIAFMADYNKKGNWLRTIKTYGENKLPAAIREKVRREYYDYHISLVREINEQKESVYFVNVEDTRSWMILRLAGDEMETVATYDK